MKTKEKSPDKVYELEIGKSIEMLGVPAPMTGDRTMTVGDLIVQMVPGLASRETDKAVRLWRIAMSIDASKERFIAVADLDFKLLENIMMGDERPIWVKVNLSLCFDEAKKRQEDKQPD
ncbi:MAG: hypothetical protein WC565_10425 [Parcubacteria group bacterium]